MRHPAPLKSNHNLLLVCYISVVDMTFTPKNVFRAIQKVEDPGLLGICMCIPGSKRDEIETQFPIEDQQEEIKRQFSKNQQKKAYINYFIEHDPEASWRSVICVLDRMDQPDSVEAADNIRHLAEAIRGRAGCLRLCAGGRVYIL